MIAAPLGRLPEDAVSVTGQTVVLLVLSNVFMTFAWYAHLKEPLKLDYVWASLCMCGAVYFMFRGYSVS